MSDRQRLRVCSFLVDFPNSHLWPVSSLEVWLVAHCYGSEGHLAFPRQYCFGLFWAFSHSSRKQISFRYYYKQHHSTNKRLTSFVDVYYGRQNRWFRSEVRCLAWLLIRTRTGQYNNVIKPWAAKNVKLMLDLKVSLKISTNKRNFVRLV